MRNILSFLTLTLSLILIPKIQANINQKITKYYHYDNKEIKISRDSFLRYGRPQLRNMLVEYFHILEKFEDINSSLITIKKQTRHLSKNLKTWEVACLRKRNDDDCRSESARLYKNARLLDRVTLAVEQDKVVNQAIFSSVHKIEGHLKLRQILDEIANENYLLLHLIEEYRLGRETPFYSSIKLAKSFNQLVRNMIFNSEMILTILLQKNLRTDFDFVWSNFFKIIEENILDKNDHNFYIQRIDELNSVWNTFHMKITKGRSKQLPKNIISVIKIMHNRWNSILKIVLR